MNVKRIIAIAIIITVLMLINIAAFASDYYIIDDSDTRRLTRSELADYSLSDLGYIRNEILARYGYPFKTDKYIDYFEDQDWYERDTRFDMNWLSSTELKNVELIKQLEEEYTDDDDDYDDDYIISDSDTRLLTKSELRAYTLSELGLIRNEILARHGYPFKTEKYRDYFEDKWWYASDDDFDYNWLSGTEMKNVELIKKIENEKS